MTVLSQPIQAPFYQKKEVNTMKIAIPDFDKVETGREPLPAATYLLKVMEAKYVSAEESGSGKPYVNWQFDVAEGELTGKKVWDITSLSTDALWKIKLLCTAAKIPFDASGFDDVDAKGRLVRGVVTIEEGKAGTDQEGKKRNRVENYLPE